MSDYITSEEIQKQLAKLTKNPGVYLFYDKRGKIIYIGKAINLKNRVRSYWNQASWKDRHKLRFMVPKIEKIETIITKSEKEALILEANLVFKHQPKYNVLLKDNKSFPWLVITYDDVYPRLIPVRNAEVFKKRIKGDSKSKFFGPYTNVGAMWDNLNLVHELFPLRRRRSPAFKNRPCLNYDLGKCLGPCQKLISEEGYQSMLDQVEMLLNGNYRDLQDILEQEMYRASEDEEFELAAKARDQIKALEIFNEKQNVISQDPNLDQDCFALVVSTDKELACLQVFKTRNGKVVNRDTVEVDFDEADSEQEIFESLFVQYYSKIPDDKLPKEIIISHDIASAKKLSESDNTLSLLDDWLSERKGSKVSINRPKRGDKYEQVQLARRNAKVIIEKLRLEYMEEASKDINVALERIRAELDMHTDPVRVECFDISHIQGSDTVASMVCFVDGLPEKKQYRKFKISVDQNDDFASMMEVITRRFKNYDLNKIEESQDCDKPQELLDSMSASDTNYDDLPNLIIIDGGKGQLNASAKILKDYGLGHITVVGLAKREEELFLPFESKPIVLDRRSPELFFVQRVRNEAHRFAVTYHRQLRSKRALRSSLDDIPGLGPNKRKLLLDHFGTLKKVKEANPEEIASLKGFSISLAEKILNKITS